jgi:hypothetical protein
VTASGFPASTFAETDPLPTGISFNSSTGVLSGTPVEGTGGTYTLAFTPTNAAGTGPTQNFTLVVDQAPTITSANNTVFNVGSFGIFTVTASGFPSSTFSETGSLPAGVSFNPVSGLLSGTPQAGTGKIYTLTLTAANGVNPAATQSFTLTVDEAPAITSPNTATFTVGASGTFTVTASGFPASTFAETEPLPPGVSFNSANGVLSGTPLAGTAGTYTLNFIPTNAAGTGPTQVFTLIVDQAPTITSANSTVFSVGTFGTFNVTASGFPSPTFSDMGALPAGVSLNPLSGLISGTPQAGTGGIYDLTLTAANGVNPVASQLFTLVVDAPPTIISPATTTFTVGSPGTFNLVATGFPVPVLGESGTLPAGVSFNAATGVLSGTPAAGTGGSYDLTFTASNGLGPTVMQSFTLVVDQAPDITSPNHATFTVGATESFMVTTTGFPSPSFVESGALPAGLVFNGTNGMLSGTPAAGTAGTYLFTITAMNGVGTPVTQDFTLTVSP